MSSSKFQPYQDTLDFLNLVKKASSIYIFYREQEFEIQKRDKKAY